MRKISKTAWVGIFIFIMIAVLTAVLFSNSILLYGSAYMMHIDSQVYIHVAQEILKGKVLYRDVFDHKGPVMYLFECAGIFFSKNNFVEMWIAQWLIFVLGVSPLFIFWAKKYNPFISVTAFLFMLAWICRTKTIGDNLPEIYAISLVCLALFFIAKIFETKRENRYHSILLGICSISLFFIKANFIILIWPSTALIFYLFWKEKEAFSFFKNYSIGLLIIAVPVIVYFACHHALYDAYFAIWKFNFSYIASQKLSMWQSVHDVFFKPVNMVLVFILLAATVNCFIFKKEKKIFFVLLTTLFLSVYILIAIPGRGRDSLHYAIPLAPVIACFIIYIATDFRKFQSAFIFCIGLFFCKPVLTNLFFSDKKKELANENAGFMIRNKKSNETLCILGNKSALYEQCGLPSNTSFFYTYPIMQKCNSEIDVKFLQQFNQKKANWVLYESQYNFDTCITSLLKDYKLVSSYRMEKLYYRE